MKRKYPVILFITLALMTLGHEMLAATTDKEALFEVSGKTYNAFSQQMTGLNEHERTQFQRGRNLVRQAWTIPPSEDLTTSGLGPLYNRISCIACHHGNGRGFAPDSPKETMKSMLVRLSHQSKSEDLPKPHPAYGDQLNEFGAPGVKGEGRALVSYSEIKITLDDGEEVRLRKPRLEFVGLAYGPLGKDTLTSARIAPSLHGLGLLEAVDESEILRLASINKPDGIKGKPNYVWDAESKKMVIGKFGWKANVPNLKQQIASAFLGDMGITSTILPKENCTNIQSSCLSSSSARSPELSDDQLQAITFYHTTLAVPKPRTNQSDIGAKLFEQAKCVHCHVPKLATSSNAVFPRFSNRNIRPYTDLLLHDMGSELADDRPDFQANGSEWRTPPLWGIGLAQTVQPKAGFMHDGRARTLLEAILWHGGEAAISANIVKKMSTADRNALLKYLESI